ncbi:MAG: hypothetical protein HOJ34_11340 [Kordiimonadaceae bacterium]|jgi:predicted metal-dependent enzyme (double-stranded beta helix superfamily)|nr:hypothetical protein [Kordiimonadaceae bacterium]MBT6330366.1 hypothetical protein [Kordiimonadaceae bacterium]MBT7583853.1 hypothetical protein [Kordiimonadaceae bacterium]
MNDYEVEVGDAVKDLIETVRRLYVENSIDAAVDHLKEAVANPAAIISDMPDFDCDEVLLYLDDHVTAYYIATTPQILYPPHEHGMIAVSAIYGGAETHIFYDRDGDDVVERSQVTFDAPNVVDLDVNAVHAISNLGERPNQTIHFYFGDLEMAKRHVWDMDGKNPRQYVHENYLNLSRPVN